MRVIQPVTSQRCFGRAKMAANFKLNWSTSNSCKSGFRSLHAKKTRQCFQVRFKLYYQAKISHAKISFQWHFKSGYHYVEIFQPYQTFISFPWDFQGETQFYIFTVLPLAFLSLLTSLLDTPSLGRMVEPTASTSRSFWTMVGP